MLANKKRRARKPDGSWRIRWLKKWHSSFVKIVAMREAYIRLFDESPDIFLRAQKKTDVTSSSVKAESRQRLFGHMKEKAFVEHVTYCCDLFKVVPGPQLTSQLETGQASEVVRALAVARRKIAAIDVPDAFLDVHSRIINCLHATNLFMFDMPSTSSR